MKNLVIGFAVLMGVWGCNGRSDALHTMQDPTQHLALATDHKGMHDVAICQDGQLVAAMLPDAMIMLDATDGREIWREAGGGTAIAFSEDGKLLAWAARHGVSVGDVASRSVRFALFGHTDYISSLCFTPDGRRLISASMSGCSVILWETSTGEKVWEIETEGLVTAIAVSSDGETVYCGDTLGNILCITTISGETSRKLESGISVTSMAAMGKNYLFVGNEAGGISLVDMAQGKIEHTVWPDWPRKTVITSLAYQPRLKRLLYISTKFELPEVSSKVGEYAADLASPQKVLFEFPESIKGIGVAEQASKVVLGGPGSNITIF